MFLRSTTKPQIVSIRGRFDQTFVFLFYEGVIVPLYKLIVINDCPPKGLFFLLGGLIMMGVDRTKNSIL